MRRERRRFLVRLGAALALAPLAACRSPTHYVEYGALRSYVARPPDAAAKRAPVVLVLPGERAIDAHVESVAKRVAQAGFVAIAPELFALEGDARVRKLVALVDDVMARPESGISAPSAIPPAGRPRCSLPRARRSLPRWSPTTRP